MNTRFALSTGVTPALAVSPGSANRSRATARSSAPPHESEVPTVLLVPGYTGSKEDFLPVLRPLAAAGYRAVAIDQRGQYQASWARSRDGYRIPALAADVVEVARLLVPDGGVHLVGHSFGGLVARAAALEDPKAFASVVLMGSGPAAIEGERRRLMDAGEPVLAERGMQALWDLMAGRSRADGKYQDASPAVLAFLRRRFLANDPVGLAVMGDELRTASDHSAELRDLALPVLVMHGVDDDAWPPAVQADMAARIGADYVVIDAAAHSPAVENPSATAAALTAFLRSVPAGG